MSAVSGNVASSRVGGIAGNHGLLLRTIDGTTWERIWGPLNTNLWGLSYGDEWTGWVVGSKGSRMVTTDQGSNWRIQRQDTLPDSLLMSVQAFDAQTARAIGFLGRSVLTTDGGTTWVNEETGTDEWLLTASFLRPTLGWVAGENGMVLKYGQLPSGKESERESIPIPWITALEQNRPNPFIATTLIRYQLAHHGPVRLNVYNVLGQAVKRLVDETQKPGAHEVSWDGNDATGHAASIGVYFYRLETLDKKQTLKMTKLR
jgi:hypothetical protein